MKNFAAGFFAGAIALVIGTLGYLRLGLLDVRSDARISDMTERLLYSGIHASVPTNCTKNPNPIAPKRRDADCRRETLSE